MKAKLLPVLTLLVTTFGCERKSGSADVVTDTSTGTVSDTGATSNSVRNKPEILSVTVRVRRADGKVGNVKVNLDKTQGADALFLSMDAIEKFAVPFYNGLGSDSVSALKKRAREELAAFGIVIGVHKKLCYIVMPGSKWRGTFPFEL
jgi:hypothetical protein